MNILFAGCGDIAQRTAAILSSENQCFGLRRNISSLPAGIQAIQADLAKPEQLHSLAEHNFDYVVVTLTPAGRSYREAYTEASENLLAALQAKPPKRVFYISSTGVYHQNEHEWINETSPALAQANGAELRAAEQVWLESSIPSTVLRLSGIYGADRLFLIKQLLAGATAIAGKHYTNRIHSDDAARAIAHLLTRDEQGHHVADTYIVSDDEPADQHAMVQWAQANLPGNKSEPTPLLGRRAGSKRCSNALLKATGFNFLYPSFRDGYRAILDTKAEL